MLIGGSYTNREVNRSNEQGNTVIINNSFSTECNYIGQTFEIEQ